ncbi:hypothetical protein LAD12857_18240 [Lacrimispora amygdalina]|uniref:DUF3068 domain-containing protein n=1 Tax=Lacrimispora amygdalina TaxID=253257 RepID=A0ABQ5M4R3_9FIRM
MIRIYHLIKFNTALLAILVFTGGFFHVSFGSERTVEIKKEFRTTNKEDEGSSHFERTIEKNGIKYQLMSLQTDYEEIIYPDSVLTIDSPPFVGNPEGYIPQETVEEGGKKYHLTASEILDISMEEKTEYSETSILYRGVEYIDKIPERAQVRVTDEDLNQEQIVELPAVSHVEESNYWDYGFTFPITVSGYQEKSYLLGDTEIPNGVPLIDYADAFLKYLNLPPDYYEITSIAWTGEPELQNGDLVRTAQARGRKAVKNIRSIYGGEVTFPAVKAKVYRGTYVEEGVENQTDLLLYKKIVTAVYERQTREEFSEILRSILTKTVLLTGFLILLIMILILHKKKKRSKTNPASDLNSG